MIKSFFWSCKAIFILTCLCLTLGVSIQAKADNGREEDHKALKQLFTEATTAFNNHDLKSFSSYFAKDYVFIGIDQSVITNQQELQAHFDQLFHSPDARLADVKTEPQFSKPTIFIDQNTGFCYGTTVETYKLKNGEETKIKSHWTATLIKESGQWKVATLHFGVNVLDNPILNKVVASTKKTTIFAFLGGLILGIFVLKMFRRSKT